eukprot:m.1566964 g.1566964  ORF g.1566964 m.1566964 type:complete len:143 (-) comp25295_c0_seq15:2694-3122(-)
MSIPQGIPPWCRLLQFCSSVVTLSWITARVCAFARRRWSSLPQLDFFVLTRLRSEQQLGLKLCVLTVMCHASHWGCIVSPGTIAADGWLKMSAPGRIAVLVNQLRKGVDLALIKKIDNPAVDIQQDACIQALVTMLRTEGDL